MAISTGILFLNGINAVIQHFSGNDITLQWYHPITIVMTGILCALPTVLLRDEDQWDRKTFWIRVSVHCLSLYAIVIGAGRLFGWYTDPVSFISVSIIFFLVYAFVWLTSHWLDKQDEKKINHALDTIRDNE
jgi:cell division protein FtsW (lipid II flippase)